MRILLPERDLHVGRIRKVQQMLSPLRRQVVPCYRSKLPGIHALVFAAREGSDFSNGDYRTWWFRTRKDGIFGKYFEIWKPVGREWYLYRAYLSLYRLTKPDQETPIIALHTDPNEEDSTEEPLRSYKRGPHLHIEMAEHPIPKCHFPLYLDYVEAVLGSTESLMKALCGAIVFLDAEVLQRLEE